MATVTFEYNGETFPCVIESEEGYEKIAVLIPETTGDYFLSIIDSSGKYELQEEVGADEVTVTIKPNASSNAAATAGRVDSVVGAGIRRRSPYRSLLAYIESGVVPSL